MKKNSKKRSLINLVTAVCILCALFCTFSTTAFAATQLSSVEIKFEKTHPAGEAPKVTATKTGTEIQEVVWNKDFSNLNPGNTVTATIKLVTKEGYVFKDTYSKSNIKITNATLVSYEYEAGNLVVKAKYSVAGQLYSPENPRWDEDKVGRARWDKVENADSYTVILVRGNKTKKVADISKTYYDFSEQLISDNYFGNDNVYFKVMAVPKSSTNLKASEYSESDYFDEWRPGAPGYYSDGWHQKGTIWYYYENGRYVIDCFKNINGHKYSFDNDGVMRVGWYKDGPSGKWYYFNPVSGEMLKGWQQISNVWYMLDYTTGAMYSSQWYYYKNNWYYLDPSGAMATGWRCINGYWYYMQPSGIMVTGSANIDGRTYYFDGSGAWIY